MSQLPPAHLRTDPAPPDPLPPDDEWVELPPEPSRGRKILVVLTAAAALLVILGGVAGLWISRQINPPGSPGDAVVVEVPEGATTTAIGDLLAAEGIIANDTVWDWYVRIRGGGPFQAGTYELAERSSMGDVVSALEAGPVPPDEVRVTVPEGLTTEETIVRLAEVDGLGLDADVLREVLRTGEVRSVHQPADQPSPEGILFPETYQIATEADERAVIGILVGQLDAVLGELDIEAAAARLGLTPYEALVVASLIEEESRVPEERSKVARVIYNRLERGIPLGIDATSRYEAELAGRDRGDIDFTSDSPYNTRRVAGLPPTPIAAPGRASLEAALNPAEGPWIYYVLADEEGNHFFTDSAAEFEQAKARCREAGLGCG